MKKYSFEQCPMRKSMEMLGGKWKLLLLETFRAQPTHRYGELRRSIPDISEKMLIQELKSLVEYGLLEKISFPEIPPRVEYTITEKGRNVLPIIEALLNFGELHSK